MPRRARQAGAEDDATIPTKIQPPSTKPPLDFSTPQSLFESFIAPVTRDEFFSTYWEKKPLLIQRSDSNVQTYYQSLFPMQGLKHASGHGIYYGRDVNLCKCKDGKKVLLSRRGKASYTEIMKDFRNAKATIQFHQPQRYNVFILQVEGEKHWRLYEPIVPLAREYEVAPLDKVTTPTHEFLLKEGDMLYFPRGVIHQADTPAGSSHSTHVTISAYQNTSWADYLQDLMPALLRDAAKENVDLRKGIPVQQLLRVGPTSAGSTLAGLLKDLANRIEGGCQLRSCEMLRDFIGHRLPPFVDANADKSVHPPNLKSTIRLKYRDYAAITVDHVPKMLDPTEELVIYVFHALNNNRESHMVSDTEESPPVSGLRFPLSHMDALKAIWENKLLHVKDLPLEGDRDKENLAISLWSEGLIESVHSVG